MSPAAAARPPGLTGPALAVNVDVDGLRLYRAIHGLPAAMAGPGGHDEDPTWSLGVPRFLSLFDRLGLRATFFVVASDLVPKEEGGEAPGAEVAETRAALLRRAVEAGHEVGSHSFSHDYALSRRAPGEILGDLMRAREVIEGALGSPVAGFRAPGYNLSGAMIDGIARSGALYSSSRFPSPLYFAAKWAVMLRAALAGRRSQSIVGEITAPLRSRRPYRHDNGLLELPVSVAPGLRVPLIGTFFTFYGEVGRRALLPLLSREPWLNIEFHALDLLGAEDAAVDAGLVAYQPDLSQPTSSKTRLFEAWLGPLARTRAPATLGRIAEDIRAQSRGSR